MRCPVCGAVWPAGASCQATFDELLVLEFTDPGYGAVHFLTVACFMIQHERYSDEGLRWIQSNLRGYLEKGLTNAQVRESARRTTNQPNRTWKVVRAADAAPLPKIAWAMTLADVAGHYTNADEYGDLIRQWARTTLRLLAETGLAPT
jgi:hypothetical protein